MKTETQRAAQLSVASHDLLAIPFAALYAEAQNVQDRILLLWLAKEYHIRQQNFDEAVKYRAMEKSLKAAVENAVATLDVSILANDREMGQTQLAFPNRIGLEVAAKDKHRPAINYEYQT